MLKNNCVLCAFTENATGSPAVTSEPAVTDIIDYDHDDFEDRDSTSADKLCVLYAVLAAAAVLVIVVLVYLCKLCLERNRRWQQARHFATMVLPPQFPNNIPRIQLMNQE